MMVLSNFDLLQWFAVVALEVTAFTLASKHKIWKVAPAFYSLLGAYASTSLVLVYCAFETSRRTYFYTYWYIDVLLSALVLATTLELTSLVTRPGKVVPHVAFTVMTNFILASAAAVSAVMAVLGNPGAYPLDYYIALDKACGYIACGLMACALIFSVIFSIRWKPLFSSIAFGLGVCALVPAALNRIEAYFPGMSWKNYWISNSAAIGAALVIWVAGIITPPSRKLRWGKGDFEQMRDLLLDTARIRRHLERTVG